MNGDRIGRDCSFGGEGLGLENYIMDLGIGMVFIPIFLDTVLTMTYDYTVKRAER